MRPNPLVYTDKLIGSSGLRYPFYNKSCKQKKITSGKGGNAYGKPQAFRKAGKRKKEIYAGGGLRYGGCSFRNSGGGDLSGME